jgi:hypothetical protein
VRWFTASCGRSYLGLSAWSHVSSSCAPIIPADGGSRAAIDDILLIDRLSVPFSEKPVYRDGIRRTSCRAAPSAWDRPVNQFELADHTRLSAFVLPCRVPVPGRRNGRRYMTERSTTPQPCWLSQPTHAFHVELPCDVAITVTKLYCSCILLGFGEDDSHSCCEKI